MNLQNLVLGHLAHMKRLVLLGLYFTLSLVLVLGTSFYYSPGALAVDMEGNMDGGGGGNDGNNMPPPEDAPATTDALTAGGGSDDDDSEGDEENDNDNANDNDNDKDDPQTPKDAPATTNTLTAKKIECQPGQEVPLFSTTCQPVPQPQQPSVTECESPSQQAASEEEEPEFSASDEGNYVSQCTPSLQFGNTGNFQNNRGFLKDGGSVSEFEPGRIEFATEPENEEGCTGATTANGQCSNTIMPTPTPVPAP